MCQLPTVGCVVSGLVFLVAYTHGLENYQYYTKDMCSKTITVYRSSSTTLSFSSGKTKVDFDDSCEVRVEGESSSDRLSFHFLSFDLDPYCADSNLTVYDGDVYSPYIQGLRTTMCGHNSTLIGLGSPITSLDYYITLFFRRNVYGMKTNSTFIVQFTTFREERLCGMTMPEYKCDNGRCIDKSLSCNENLNPCGDHSDCRTEEPGVGTIIVNIIQQYWPIAIAVAALYFVFKWCKVQKRAHGEYPVLSKVAGLFSSGTSRGEYSRDQPAELSMMVNGSENGTARRDSVSSTSSLSPTEDTPGHQSRRHSLVLTDINLRNVDDTGLGFHAGVTSHDNDVPNASLSYKYDDVAWLPPTAPPDPTSLPPPPSYDDALMNEDVYTKAS